MTFQRFLITTAFVFISAQLSAFDTSNSNYGLGLYVTNAGIGRYYYDTRKIQQLKHSFGSLYSDRNVALVILAECSCVPDENLTGALYSNLGMVGVVNMKIGFMR